MGPETFLMRINFSSRTRGWDTGLTLQTCTQTWSPALRSFGRKAGRTSFPGVAEGKEGVREKEGGR